MFSLSPLSISCSCFFRFLELTIWSADEVLSVVDFTSRADEICVPDCSSANIDHPPPAAFDRPAPLIARRASKERVVREVDRRSKCSPVRERAGPTDLRTKDSNVVDSGSKSLREEEADVGRMMYMNDGAPVGKARMMVLDVANSPGVNIGVAYGVSTSDMRISING